MDQALTSFLISLGAVTLAEMGDKTQLLAMAFATKYKAHKVLAGVFVATVLNHALAVAVGTLLAEAESIRNWIQLLASLSFLFFGLWSIRGDELAGEDKRKTRFGAVVTVTVAFFLAELGDKTQLATIALAARYPAAPVFVLLGTTAGMLVADSVGIFAGRALCRWVPERTIKLISAGAFLLFGLLGTWQALTGPFGLGVPFSAAIVLALALVSGLLAWYIARRAARAPSACDANPSEEPLSEAGRRN